MRDYDEGGIVPYRESVMGTLQAHAPDLGMRVDPRSRCVGADMSLMLPLFLAAAMPIQGLPGHGAFVLRDQPHV